MAGILARSDAKRPTLRGVYRYGRAPVEVLSVEFLAMAELTLDSSRL
jgi:hypothetical protein